MITGEGESRNFNNPTLEPFIQPSIYLSVRSHFISLSRSQPGRVGVIELHITSQLVSSTLAEAMRRLASLTCLDEKSMFGAAAPQSLTGYVTATQGAGLSPGSSARNKAPPVSPVRSRSHSSSRQGYLWAGSYCLLLAGHNKISVLVISQ